MPIKETESRLLTTLITASLLAALVWLVKSIYNGKYNWRRLLFGSLLTASVSYITASLVLHYLTLAEHEVAAVGAFVGYLGSETMMAVLLWLLKKRLGSLNP